MKKTNIIICLQKTDKWYSLKMYNIETKSYAEQGRSSQVEIMRDLLQYPVLRDATFEVVTIKQFNKISGC